MVKVLQEGRSLKRLPSKCIKGATLLSADEAKNLLTDTERNFRPRRESCIWWLREPVDNENVHVACVVCEYYGGSVFEDGDWMWDEYGYIRPALIISRDAKCNYKVGDTFVFGGHTFKIISDDLALCKDDIGRCAFKINANKQTPTSYENSDVKKKIDEWFRWAMRDLGDEEDFKAGRISDTEIEKEWDLGF